MKRKPIKTKVLIVDDHPFTRAGVKAILGMNKSIEVVGEAVDGLDAIDKVNTQHPDVIIMDITMPKLSVIAELRNISPFLAFSIAFNNSSGASSLSK